MPPHISRLAQICAANVLREKILVVPSLAIGHQIADAVAQSGTPWVNLRVETIRTLADAVTGFDLAREGITVLSRAQALALIERACDRVLDEHSYFAALADRPGLHRAIQKSIDDLRHSGIDAIPPNAFEDERKAADIARILAAYEEELRAGKYIDRFGVLARAIRTVKPRSDDPIWYVVDDVELTPAEEKFLLLCGAPPLSRRVPESDTPRITEIKQAIGEENELRAAFRNIATFDDAEIVYTNRDCYLPLAYELASEYEIPTTFAEGIAAHFTRPGQAALAFLRWIGNGYHARELQIAARAGAIATPGFARILRRARIGWGRERYLKRIDALLADEELSERTRADAQAAREVMAKILAIDVRSPPAATSAFLLQFANIRNDADAMAREGLRRMLDELAAIRPAEAGPHTEAETSRLAEAVSNLHVAASNPRPGFLHVAPIRAGGWSARKKMFIVGLDESKHPGSNLQDPVILDEEREAIGIAIVGDRPRRATEQLQRLLARASDREVTMSYASIALQDRRERFPSSSIRELHRASKREGFIDPIPLSGSEWWLLRRFADGDANIAEGVRAAYPGLIPSTREKGLIDAPAEELDPRLNEKIYSASQLEKMAGCPYRHFLERILKIDALDDIEYDQDIWLEAHEFGSLIHEVLQTTMETLKPSTSSLPQMKAIADAALDQWRDAVPPPSEAAFEKRREDLHDACEVFLRMEEESSRTITPKYFEHEFEFTLPLGGGKSVKLRGRIDRIDLDETRNEWHVWDYKSGSTYQFDRGGVLSCGTKIQHALYARAVEATLGGRVTKSGYVFPTSKGGGARLERKCTDQELRDALNALFDVVASGYFPHGSADNCKFCEFKSICFDEAGKFVMNEAWQRLQGIR